MQKILSLIDRLLHFLLITTVLLLIIPVSLQIFSRFTELIPRYMWTEEMSRFFFFLLIMLGATLGVRERLHFDVDFLPELSPRATHVLLRLSQTAMLIFSAGTFDLLIGGWELVGITSVLLVAFFHQRRNPVRSSVQVYSAYKIGDLGLLLGVFVLHYFSRTADMSVLFQGTWPMQTTSLSPVATTLTGLLFLFAAAAKSAQIPFSGWLPRAMEGPTPSSAIFYGAISVHAGAYLLLRIEPVLRASPLAAAAVIAVGLLSAILGTMIHRVAADAKTSIVYAAMTQLGVIFMEIGFGFPRLALAHIVGHAVVRTLQFLRAPSMLHDYHRVHAAAGGHLATTGEHYKHILPESVRMWAYRFALDRGFYDALASRIAVAPILALSRWLASFEPYTAAPPPSQHLSTTVEELAETKA